MSGNRDSSRIVGRLVCPRAARHLHAAEGTSTSKEPESGTIQKRPPPTPTLTVYCVLRKFRAVRQVDSPLRVRWDSSAGEDGTAAAMPAISGAVTPIAANCCSAACCAVCGRAAAPGTPKGSTPPYGDCH